MSSSLVPDDGLAAYPVVTFEDLAKEPDERTDGQEPPTVLDVRRDDERAAGAIPGSSHIPIHALLERLDDVPSGTLWVHCASGYRSAICASLLAREGHDVVLIDDDFEQAVELGLTTTGD